MRTPAVAGQFYPSGLSALKELVEKCFLHKIGPGSLPKPKNAVQERNIAGAVVPHAGYIYSGPVAANVYFELSKQKNPEVVIILGPNHTGRGSGVAVSRENWKTPLGEVKVDSEIADFFWKNCELIDSDEAAHEYEHSIEVQLPFLQYIYGEFKFVPICMGMQDIDIAEEIAECISRIKKDILILASSDFTHYEPKKHAAEKDKKAIEHILNLDEKKFIQTVYENDISICGYGAIAACISAVKKIGTVKAELLKYATSGEITGDDSSVVAYAGIAFRKIDNP